MGSFHLCLIGSTSFICNICLSSGKTERQALNMCDLLQRASSTLNIWQGTDTSFFISCVFEALLENVSLWRKLIKQKSHSKMYLLPENLALRYITLCCLYALHFVTQHDGCDMVSLLSAYDLPVFCTSFPWSSCQKLRLSKPKEIQSSLLSNWNVVAWLPFSYNQRSLWQEKWTLLKWIQV